MNTNTFNEVVEAQIKLCTDILCKKAGEYADNENDERLHNFKSVAGFTGQDPKTVLFGMWAKHLASVKDMCLSDEHYSMDTWNEKLTDTINYALLLKALVVEQEEMKNPFELEEVSFSVDMKPEEFKRIYTGILNIKPCEKPDPNDPWDLRNPDTSKGPNDIPQNPVECGPNSACMTH